MQGLLSPDESVIVPLKSAIEQRSVRRLRRRLRGVRPRGATFSSPALLSTSASRLDFAAGKVEWRAALAKWRERSAALHVINRLLRYLGNALAARAHLEFPCFEGAVFPSVGAALHGAMARAAVQTHRTPKVGRHTVVPSKKEGSF